MKRLLVSLFVIIFSLFAALVTVIGTLAVFFSANAPKDPVLESLPDYESREYYSAGHIGDFTDYGKYTYRIDETVLQQNSYLSPIAEADIPIIWGYLDNFENWVEICTDFPREYYDFDRSSLDEGDFFTSAMPIRNRKSCTGTIPSIISTRGPEFSTISTTIFRR